MTHPSAVPSPPLGSPISRFTPQGVVIFIRRTSEAGAVSLLGHSFKVDPLWPHRLVRCEIDLSNQIIRFHALRRRDPDHQPLLCRTIMAASPSRDCNCNRDIADAKLKVVGSTAAWMSIAQCFAGSRLALAKTPTARNAIHSTRRRGR